MIELLEEPRQLFERAELRSFERSFGVGEAIFYVGDDEHTVWSLVSGVSRVYKIYGGGFREVTTDLPGPGEIIGRLDLRDDARRVEYAEAITPVSLVGVRKADLLVRAESRPEFMLQLCELVARRVRHSEQHAHSLLYREVETRLAITLVNLFPKFGYESAEGSLIIDVRLTHQQLADMIACTREATSKAMSVLQREGILQVREKCPVILDSQALARRAYVPEYRMPEPGQGNVDCQRSVPSLPIRTR